MSVVHLLTGEEMPKPDPETHLLTAALTQQGVGHRVLRWTDPEVGAGADLVVVRTPWDYIHRCDEFLDVCRNAGAPVLNSPDVLAWNSHKGYLVELAEAGVPVVPTRLVRAGADAALRDGEGRLALVVKPAVSSGSRGAGAIRIGRPGGGGAPDRSGRRPRRAGAALRRIGGRPRGAVADLPRRRVLPCGGQAARRRRLPRAGDIRGPLPHARADGRRDAGGRARAGGLARRATCCTRAWIWSTPATARWSWSWS